MSIHKQRQEGLQKTPFPAEWLVEMEDADAWLANPKHRWVYDRLLVADTQAYAHAPLGVTPSHFPVIVKPITNLYGMGIGARRVSAAKDLIYAPGMMWAAPLEGRHVSTDLLVDRGEVMWSAQATGFPSDKFGRFDLWALHSQAVEPELSTIRSWLKAYLADYAGPLNAELIGSQIIEVHLRLSTDWQRAGCYRDYTSHPSTAYGIPLFGRLPRQEDLPGAWLDSRGESERTAFVVVNSADIRDNQPFWVRHYNQVSASNAHLVEEG